MFLSNKKEPGYSFYVLLPINDHFLFLVISKHVFFKHGLECESCKAKCFAVYNNGSGFTFKGVAECFCN